MRVLLPVALCLAFGVTARSQDAMPRGPVDLSQPGVLEQLKRDDPARYAAIQDILKVSAKYPCQASALRTLKTRWDLKDVTCGAILKTSYPAQRLLTFELKNTPYTAHLVVPPGERLEPAVATR